MDERPNDPGSLGIVSKKSLHCFRISIAASLRRQSQLVTTPLTSARSITNVIMNGSHSDYHNNALQKESQGEDEESQLPELHLETPSRHSRTSLRTSKTPLDANQRSWFDDSSDMEEQNQLSSPREGSVSPGPHRTPANQSFEEPSSGGIGVAQSRLGERGTGSRNTVDFESYPLPMDASLTLNPDDQFNQALTETPAFPLQENFNNHMQHPAYSTFDAPEQSPVVDQDVMNRELSKRSIEALMHHMLSTGVDPNSAKFHRILKVHAITLNKTLRLPDRDDASRSRPSTRMSGDFGSSEVSSLAGAYSRRSRPGSQILKSGVKFLSPTIGTNAPDRRSSRPMHSIHSKRRSLSSPPVAEAPPVPPLPRNSATLSAAGKVPLFATPAQPSGGANKRLSAPSQPLRTPYPTSPPEPTALREPAHMSNLRSDPGHRSLRHTNGTRDLRRVSEAITNMVSADSILTLSVRRRYGPCGRRISRLVIPADTEMAFPARSHRDSITSPTEEGQKELQAAKRDYDDARLFYRLRDTYYGDLLGDNFLSRFSRRWLSARSLNRIVLVTADVEPFVPSGNQRTPRVLVRRGLSTTFTEDKLLSHFFRPAQGLKTYSWVHWAHRVALDCVDDTADEIVSGKEPAEAAAMEGIAAVNREDDEKDESTATNARAAAKSRRDGRHHHRHRRVTAVPGGLEFVEGWSAWRISFAVILVILCAIASVLAWVFEGPVSATAWSTQHSHGNRLLPHYDAEGRVGSGIALGILVLVMGWMMLGLWIAASWIVM